MLDRMLDELIVASSRLGELVAQLREENKPLMHEDNIPRLAALNNEIQSIKEDIVEYLDYLDDFIYRIPE